VTSTWTDTSLNGDFDSSVKSFTAQPRVGLLWEKWAFWVGGMYLDTQEDHSGVVSLPVLGPIPFAVELESASKWNTSVGAGYAFSTRANLYLELGFGDRDHTLFNFTYRF
jgi:predicted porin